jgi:hypothetical protein
MLKIRALVKNVSGAFFFKECIIISLLPIPSHKIKTASLKIPNSILRIWVPYYTPLIQIGVSGDGWF